MSQLNSLSTIRCSHHATEPTTTVELTTTISHMKNHIAELRLSHLCSFAALTLGCLAGCQTAREVVDSSTPAMQSPTSVMSRAGNRVGESFETAFEPLSRPTSSNASPIQQTPEEATASKIPTYPKSLARYPSQVILPPQPQVASSRPTAAQPSQPRSLNSPANASSVRPPANALTNNGRGNDVEFLAPPPAPAPSASPKTVQPVAGNAPANSIERRPDNTLMKSARPESAPAPIAPPEPLPANSVDQSRAITPISAVTTHSNTNVTTAAATNVATSNTVSPPTSASNATAKNAALTYTTWCRVRVRNTGTQAATQVALSVTAPPNAQLLATDGRVLPSQTNGHMVFTAIPQVGPNEEVVVTVGVAAADNHSNRLRVQVRDALGGTNQEVQSRWKVTLEAAEQPK